MDIAKFYYKPYTKEDNPTDEQILEYIEKIGLQYCLIDDIKKRYDKENKHNTDDLLMKSNEELKEIRKQYILPNIA